MGECDSDVNFLFVRLVKFYAERKAQKQFSGDGAYIKEGVVVVLFRSRGGRTCEKDFWQGVVASQAKPRQSQGSCRLAQTHANCKTPQQINEPVL